MGKLSKEAAKAHREADALTRLERDLTEDEREFVLEYWQESADTASVLDGAYFTPMGLAAEVAHHVHGHRVIRGHRPSRLRRPPLLGQRAAPDRP